MSSEAIIEERVKSLVNVTVDDIALRYTIKEELGSGAQATVYKGLHKKTSAKVAIKVIEARELEDDELYDALRMEVNLMRQLKHPNVVSLQEVVRDKVSIFLVQECLAGGELFDKLLAKGPFNEEDTLAIFAQVACGLDYLHANDVVHRDLKAENLVFVAKGSPQIKFIDFGGAAPYNPAEGLTGLVGTPQYVAPEVVIGYGDTNPTEKPYGKACDLWSLGVLLYVMLSKMMPFRAKEIDLLLKQVVKGKFFFKPEDRWSKISPSAKDLITKLLEKDPAKRLTIAQVKEHAWAKAAIANYEANLPKLEAKLNKQLKASGGGGMLSISNLLAKSSSSKAVKGDGEVKAIAKKSKASREQQYWYAMEISPPTDMQKVGGVRVGEDGTFQMDNAPPEMKAILEEIQRQKAAGASARTSGLDESSSGKPPPYPLTSPAPGAGRGRGQPPVSSGPPPLPAARPPGGPPPLPTTNDAASSEMYRLNAEQDAFYRTGGANASDAMDTLVLLQQKDEEIQQLSQTAMSQSSEIEVLQAQIATLRVGSQSAPAPPPLPPSSGPQLEAVQRELDAANARAERAEALLEEQQTQQIKLQAKLSAVTTLYTEAMQREATLKVMLEHAGGP